MILPFIEAGEIVTTHGVRGEIKVLPYLDSPEMLLGYRRCLVGEMPYRIRAVRVQKGCNLVKLDGVDTMEAAQALRGQVIKLYRGDIAPELIFAAELIGVEVFSGEDFIGKITDVLDYPGNSVYVIQGEREYLIPAVKEYILHTDLKENRMEVKLIEGMASDEN